MKVTRLFSVGAMAAAMLASPLALADVNLSATQKTEVQQVIRDYLMTHPEILVDVSRELEKKQQAAMQTQAKSAILQNSDQLFSGKLTTIGNTKGNVTVVEFFDYQCGHCKRMKPIIASLLKKDSNLRVVYKEFPIFGKESEFAAQVAMAAGMQGKYQQMNEALLQLDKNLDKALVLKTASDLGLNMQQLQKDITNPEIVAVLKQNKELAQKLKLMGTPAFIVAATPDGVFNAKLEPTLIPGGASEQTLQTMIDKAAKA